MIIPQAQSVDLCRLGVMCRQVARARLGRVNLARKPPGITEVPKVVPQIPRGGFVTQSVRAS